MIASRRTERLAILLGAAAVVVGRALVFVWWEQSHFDADQAIVGLMAKHLIEGRAFPLFFYGQQYLLGVEAWLVAPALWLGGVSVASLKLPLVLMNVALVVGLILALERFAGLRPALAGLASLFVILPPPGTASRLVQANGCNIEPFLYVLLIWLLRARPLWLGLVAAVGVLNREFTMYAVVALLAVELAQGDLWRGQRIGAWGLALLVALGIWQAVQVLIPFASAQGPGTSFRDASLTPHLAEVGRRFCWNEDQVFDRLAVLFTDQLPELFGARRQPVSRVGIIGDASQGMDGLWPVMAAGLALALVRAGWSWRRRAAPSIGAAPFCAYLALVGAQSAIFYAVTCGQRSHLTMRYMLLALFVPVGVSAFFLAVEQSRALVLAYSGLIVCWAGVSAVAHVSLLKEYLLQPPPAHHRVLTQYLEAHGVRHGLAAFWDAYAVTFLSGERVRVGSSDLIRIDEYRRQFYAHPDGAAIISFRPCAGAKVARWWVCPATPSP